jgi:hypothetical protein
MKFWHSSHFNQHAYQPGKSVETVHHQLEVRVQKDLDQQEIALGIFLDKEAMFNSTSYDSTCAALARHGVDLHHRTTDHSHPGGSAGHGDSRGTFQKHRGV